MSFANESAFPEITTEASYDDGSGPFGHVYSCGGLTKRDLFAAMALQGMCANSSFVHDDDAIQAFAHDAVMHADALLAELAKMSTHTSHEQREAERNG